VYSHNFRKKPIV